MTNAELTHTNSFPYSPQGKRIIANDFIRSSLFSATNKKNKRRLMKDEQIACYGKTEIKYRGEELRQEDEDVFMLIVHCLRDDKFSVDENTISFMPFSFIRRLGWPKSTKYKRKLYEIISRLTATSLTVKNRQLQQGIAISLVRKFVFQDQDGEDTKYWKVYLEKEISVLFRKNGYSKINWEERTQLTPLAKWTHAFYASHAEPYPLKVSTIYRLCGSTAKNLYHFKADLKKALISLVKVGFLEDFFIDLSNTVHVLRKGQDDYVQLQ